MTSGLIYAFQYMADCPEVFAKVRQEQLELRGDSDVPITLDVLDQSPYLRAFVKEVLRLRREWPFAHIPVELETAFLSINWLTYISLPAAPVIMVPYSAKKAFPISDSYTVPKGSIVIPSFWNSLHDPQVYADPDEFKPERWLPGGQAENSNPANYLVVSCSAFVPTSLVQQTDERLTACSVQFGSGPHKCIAYDYAMMHIAAVIGSAALRLDWTHKLTETSDNIKIIATLFPEDDCLLQFKPADISVI
jgi:C-22 sterol desaturase